MQFQRNDNNGSANSFDWPIVSEGIDVSDRVGFYAPLAVDPNIAGRVYWGTHRLYRSDNRGGLAGDELIDWTAISPDLTTARSSFSAISNFAIALELSKALKRRCLYLFMTYPTPAQELQIGQMQVPELNPKLAQDLVTFVQQIRALDLKKSPSIGETLDWAKALLKLNAKVLDQEILMSTLSVLLKHEGNIIQVERELISPT